MDSSVSGKDEIWFLRVCHHVPHELYTSFKCPNKEKLGGVESADWFGGWVGGGIEYSAVSVLPVHWSRRLAGRWAMT